MQPEYDVKSLRVRRLGPERRSFGDTVRLETDVAKVFPGPESVNEALRFLIRVTNGRPTGNGVRSPTGRWSSNQRAAVSSTRHSASTERIPVEGVVIALRLRCHAGDVDGKPLPQAVHASSGSTPAGSV